MSEFNESLLREGRSGSGDHQRKYPHTTLHHEKGRLHIMLGRILPKRGTMAHVDYHRVPHPHDDRAGNVHKRKALELLKASRGSKSLAYLMDYTKRPKLIEDNQYSHARDHDFSHVPNQEQKAFEEQPIYHSLSATAEQVNTRGCESGSERSYVDSDSSDHVSQSTATSTSSSPAPECGIWDLSNQPQYHPLIDHGNSEEVINLPFANSQQAISHNSRYDILQSCSGGFITDIIELPPVLVVEQGKPLSEIPDHNTLESSHSNDSSSVASTLTSVHSHNPSLSSMEIDVQTTDGDDSSQSRESSDVSESITEEAKSRYGNDLEDLIKNDILLTAPELADYFYQAVKGRLECASRRDLAQVDQSHGVSLLQLIELEAFGISELSEAAGAVSLASSSSSSSASASYLQDTTTVGGIGTGDSFSGTSTTRNPASTGDRRDERSDQLLKPKKKSQKSTSTEEPKASGLRCIHNVMSPDIFSVNLTTHHKFRPCGGPGWKSFQHLKEHMKSHHTKPVKTSSQLQCSRCQDEFPDQEELKAHELDVDCPIRCIDCREEFKSKAFRQQHQKLVHQEEAIECIYMELDESMWKSINKNLKAYTDALKKGKGRVDPVLDRWITANIARFEVGRSEKAKASAKLELGQWYTMYKTLVPQARIDELPTHPFYDSGIPHSEYAQEKLIYINDRMVQAKIDAYGPPPVEINGLIGWLRDALRDSVKVSARVNAPHLMQETPFVPRDSRTTLDLYQLGDAENAMHTGPSSLLTDMEASANFTHPIPSTTKYVSTAQFQQANQMSHLSNENQLESHVSDMDFVNWPVNSNGLSFLGDNSEIVNFNTEIYPSGNSGLDETGYGGDWTKRSGST
ncbi:hypothetical protein BKA65DRAFT_519650 [Rhexocercosporidium sp. MPI-PUGE-AT-0058]|nr:hypothetical protein BKA65DRAFT_519650 [Rhexocercosporidium sp. MPI-PUGE-AT-0058]